MLTRIALTIISLLILISCSNDIASEKPQISKQETQKIDSLADRYLELNRFSGIIHVSEKGSTLYHKYFGLANYESKESFTEQTAFKIGKITELITAEILKDMDKNGSIQLSDKVSKYLPEFKHNYSIQELLDHQTNFPSIESIQEKYPELSYSTITFANQATDSTGKLEKSGLNYNVLGLLIETISTKSYQENIEGYSQTLGLEHTYYQKQDPIIATGYLYHNYRGQGLELQKAPEANPEITFSNGGLKSTAKDLAKILASMDSKEIEMHGYMASDGFSYSLMQDPEKQRSIIILSNFRHPVAKEISNSIEAILEGNEYQLPLLREAYAIDTDLLKDYSGNYALNENMDLSLIHEKDSLFVMMGPNKVSLTPQSANQFYMEERDASMRFLRDSVGQVYAVELLDGFLDGNTINRKN